MKIVDLPQFVHLKERRDVKVVRHKSSKHDYLQMLEDGEFEDYQNEQSRDVFGGATTILSFIARSRKRALFIGAWGLLGKRPREPRGFIYRTKELSGYDDLKRRLIVEWGDGALCWVQWLHKKGNKEVLELRPANYDSKFPGYYDVVLPFARLARIVLNPDSHSEWKKKLTAVSGVYLITDTKGEKQYVGSAYGKEGGIWGRWKTYVSTRHGNNDRLIALLKDDPERYRSFQFSILRVFEPGMLPESVCQHEALVKRKLGTRAFGLNC
jgi:hypothetical protein